MIKMARNTTSNFDLIWQVAQSSEAASMKELTRAFVESREELTETRKELFSYIDGLSDETSKKFIELDEKSLCRCEELKKLIEQVADAADDGDSNSRKYADEIREELVGQVEDLAGVMWENIHRLENMIVPPTPGATE